MNSKQNRNTVVIILAIATAAVWCLVIGGWVKNAVEALPSSAKSESEKNEKNYAAEASPDDLFQFPDANNSDNVQDEFEISGIWDVSYCRYYYTEYEGTWEPLGLDEVFLWMEIYPGEFFECDIMPTEAYINGEQYTQSLAPEPQLCTGEISGDTLMLYLDLDNFYLDYNTEVTDTIEPQYIEIPLTQQNGSLYGSCEYTWVVNIEGYDMQSRVTFEVTKR